jgi:hypothetical protein
LGGGEWSGVSVVFGLIDVFQLNARYLINVG